MSESSGLPGSEGANPSAHAGMSAGAMLRAARERTGTDLDTMSQLLKVPVAKLEAMEADRHGELPGLAFVRGLAVSMCRHMGVEARPILEALPTSSGTPEGKGLESVNRGLAEPYREPSGRSIILPAATSVLRKGMLIPLVFLALALALWLVPGVPDLRSYLPGMDAGESAEAVPDTREPAQTVQELPSVNVAPASAVQPAVPASGASAVGGVSAVREPTAVVDTVFSAPREVADSASAVTDTAPDGVVVVRTSSESWVEARDATGKVLMSRMVSEGEDVGVNGELPIRLKVGNASAATVLFKGQPFDLRPYTSGSVARVELK